MSQLGLDLAHAPPAMRARCRTCRRWVPTTRDGARLAEHGTARRDPRRRPPSPRPCPGSGRELETASRVVYACGCSTAQVPGLLFTAFGGAPHPGVGPCCVCGQPTRRAEYLEPGPRCATCRHPVHRHHTFCAVIGGPWGPA